MEKNESDLQKLEQNLENLKLVLLEPEEKLNVYKLIVGDISLLDSHINQRDNLIKLIESKKREMLKAGKILYIFSNF